MNSKITIIHHVFHSCPQVPGYSLSDRYPLGFCLPRFFGIIRYCRVVLILCAFAIAGCQAFIDPESEGLLLSADFEGYQEGQSIVPTGQDVDPLAGGDIPGLPSGDKFIVCSPTTNPEMPCFPNCNGSTYSVRSNDPISGQKSLLYQYARLEHCSESCNICEDAGIIDFVPEPPFVPLSSGERVIPILFFWNGRLSNVLDDTIMEVTVHEKGEFFFIY